MNIYISQFLKEKNLELTYQNYKIIIDVEKGIFLTNIKYLFLNLLYPLYYNSKNIIIDNIYEFNNDIFIDSKYIHNDLNIIEMYLYLEAWNKLINIKNIKNTYNKIYAIDNLNKYQQIAVDKINGPFKLLAPAGSGKTKTLINRVLNILNYGVKEENILILAFNKKAEIELKNRIYKYDIKNVEIKTFHSFGNSIIKENTDLEQEIDDYEFINKSILEEVLYNNKISTKNTNDYLEEFTKYKNCLTNKEDMILNNKNIFNIYEDYNNALDSEKIYGFDDMIYKAIKIILENGKLRDKLQNKYKYILVDEVQDLNNAQLLLIKILSLPLNNLFIVGDDDQTIYTFRGANVNGVLNFENDYSCSINETLKINYRSKANIVNNSKKLIDNNTNRIYKDINPFKKDNGNIELFIGKNILEECEKIVKWIRIQQSNNISNNEIAILYRYHEFENILKLYLLTNKIPMNCNNDFDVLKQIKPFFNYLFRTPTHDDYKLILKNYNYYIDDKTLKRINSKKKFLYYLKRVGLNFISFKLKFLNNFLKKHDIGFKQFMFIFKIKNNIDVINTLNQYGKLKKIDKMVNSNYEKYINQEDGIVLSTIHKVKGNEFDSVCYYHLMTPDTDIEGERKISYVGFTRAKSNLLVTTIKDDKHLFINEFFNN